jgi:hypothetical protein
VLNRQPPEVVSELSHQPRGIAPRGRFSFVRQAPEVAAWRMGSARAEPLRIAFFTSPMALVMRISRGQASVQLKMVRQSLIPYGIHVLMDCLVGTHVSG